MITYRVEQFLRSADVHLLADRLNKIADEGWRLKAVSDGGVGMTQPTDSRYMVLFFERDGGGRGRWLRRNS